MITVRNGKVAHAAENYSYLEVDRLRVRQLPSSPQPSEMLTRRLSLSKPLRGLWGRSNTEKWCLTERHSAIESFVCLLFSSLMPMFQDKSAGRKAHVFLCVQTNYHLGIECARRGTHGETRIASDGSVEH